MTDLFPFLPSVSQLRSERTVVEYFKSLIDLVNRHHERNRPYRYVVTGKAAPVAPVILERAVNDNSYVYVKNSED